MRATWLAAAVGAMMAPAAASAQVKLAPIFGNNMVLQREMAVPIWGTSVPGDKVTVSFAGQEKSATANEKGAWSVKLDALKAGGPHELKVTGKNSVTLTGVLVGEVWVCSGQSNMAWQLKQTEKADEEIAASANDQLRLNGGGGNWVSASPMSSGGFSATGYYFGKDLQKALKVPVGLINRSVGGTSARRWTSKSAVLEAPALKEYAKDILGDELKGNCGDLYEGMIRPLIPLAMRGVIWYQGESDASHPAEYAELIQTMIRSWRSDWGQGDFPFLYVHLGAIGGAPKTPAESGWGPIREAQDAALKLPKTAMAGFTDSDADLHPRKKAIAGSRLALAARAVAYGEPIVASGPTFDKVRTEGNKLIVEFKNVGEGLKIKGDALKGFAIAGTDGKYAWADAQLVGKNAVALTSKEVASPATVRYAYASNPLATLYNMEGLPAVPFRTDTTPLPNLPTKKK